MTQIETAALLGILRVTYPRFYADIPPEDIKISVDTWTLMLSDTSFEVAQVALQRLIATSKFPPTIAEMRESISAVRYPSMLDSGEAWGEVTEAIRNYGYYRQEEAMASMCEPVRLAVQRMGWRELCMSENGMADRAHFLRIYESMVKRTKEENQLPIALKEAIKAIGLEQSSNILGDDTRIKTLSPSVVEASLLTTTA
jgi:hypothetical protein